MNFLKNLGAKIFSTKRGRWIFGILVVLLLALLVRSCSKIRIISNSTYHIARTVNWYPIQLSGKEANLQAFIDELITDIAEDENLKVDITTYNSGDLFARLDNEEYDGIILTIAPTSFLKERYAVSESIFLAGPVLVVPLNSKITDLNQLVGKPIGVIKDSPLGFQLMSQHPDLRLITYNDIISALNDVETHIIFGVILEAQLAYTYTQALYPGKFRVATPPLVDLGIHLVTRKEERGEALIASFNKGLEKLKHNGGYLRLLNKWELVTPKS